jgi:hypothetical protein
VSAKSAHNQHLSEVLEELRNTRVVEHSGEEALQVCIEKKVFRRAQEFL